MSKNLSLIGRAAYAMRYASAVSWWALTGQEWEGWERNRYRNRPARSLGSQDESLNYGKREELISEARDLCRKFGIARRIKRQYANYVVGDCKVQFTTSDEEWNSLAEQNFNLRAQNLDYCGRHNLKGMSKLAVQSWITDGDIFFAKTDANGFPQLQPIEADRVGNYRGGYQNVDEEGIVGGVKINKQGLPLAYRVWQRRFDSGVFRDPQDIPATSVLHLFDPDRFDANRGVTQFHTALNRARSLKEIVDAEQSGVLANSKWALLFKTFRGGRGPQPQGIDAFGGTNTDTLGNTITTEPVGDAAIQYVFPGEDMQAHISNRPSPAWQGFVDFLIREIAVGFDLPVEFVWMMSGAGPAVRMISKQAERTFNGAMDILELKFLHPTCAWVTLWDMANGNLPQNEEWFKFYFPRPAHISIDAGRDANANLQELDAGANTIENIAREQGTTGEAIRLMRKTEARAILENTRELVKEFDDLEMTPDAILNLLGRPNAAQTATLSGVQKNVAQPNNNPESRLSA